MSDSTTRRAADALAVTSLLLLVMAALLIYRTEPEPLALVSNIAQGGGYVVAFGAVGWLLVRRMPGNPIGWCFSMAGLVWAVSGVAHGRAAMALEGVIAFGALERVCALIDNQIWILGMPFSVCLPLFLLPNGRPLSARWSRGAHLVLAGMVLGAVGFTLRPGTLSDAPYEQVINPLGAPQLGPLPDILAIVGTAAILLGTVAGAVSVIVRFRRSRGIERQQLRWVVFGGIFALLSTAISATVPAGPATSLASVAGISAVPICVGIAVLRYRLYDLGRIVSRTVSFAVVSALLLGVYLGLVTLSLQFLPSGSRIAVAASTLGAAALFQPLRSRVQSGVDRRFNRAQFDADVTSAEFGRRLRDEVELDVVRRDLITVVQGTLEPTHASLWLRDRRA